MTGTEDTNRYQWSAVVHCTDACEATPECKVCRLRKAPRGRSLPLEIANGWCGWDCPGYAIDPLPGHLWPGERARALQDAQGER